MSVSSLSVCLSVCLSIGQSVSRHCLSVSLSIVWQFFCLLVFCLSVSLSVVCQSVCLSVVCLSVSRLCLSVCLSVVSVCLSVSLSVSSLSVCLFLSVCLSVNRLFFCLLVVCLSVCLFSDPGSFFLLSAALGPPSSLKLSSVKEDLEIIITDPLSSTNQSMKTLLKNKLSYLIQYWRRSEGPQKAKVLETKNNLVMLTELDRQTWYCVRVQSHDDFHNKSSVFSDTHCTRTEGQMPYWQIFLYVLISLLLCLLLVLLYFCFNKMLSLLKNTFCPAVHLPDHIQELWLSESETPQLLAPESPESVCEPLVMVSAELDAVAVDEHSNAGEQDSSTHSRHSSGDSGVYSTEEDSSHRSTTHADLQMSSRKHGVELRDGTLRELCA
uniref:Interleukin 10 receptor, beta n=1 Tax=Cyprinus carpio carpio TaxID=630221 RepID=A0A9J8AAX1_CYPCA